RIRPPEFQFIEPLFKRFDPQQQPSVLAEQLPAHPAADKYSEPREPDCEVEESVHSSLFIVGRCQFLREPDVQPLAKNPAPANFGHTPQAPLVGACKIRPVFLTKWYGDTIPTAALTVVVANGSPR